jgi:uncharacterized protein (TIGR00730 family)
MSTLSRVCVYCSSRSGKDPSFLALARGVGGLLARRGIDLVWGGGNVGLMGALADGVLEAGGRAIGVIPRAMVEREIAHQGASELHIVGSMHERKALMEKLSDGFVALPGGTGTLDELFEMWTWSQLGIHAKPIGLLDAGGFWQPLIACVDRMVEVGFLWPEQRAMVSVESDAERLLDVLAERAAVRASPAPGGAAVPVTP